MLDILYNFFRMESSLNLLIRNSFTEHKDTQNIFFLNSSKYCQWEKCRKALDSYYFSKVKLRLSSLLEGLWLPKLDRYDSWERSPGDTPLLVLVTSSRWGHVTLNNTYSFSHMSVWVFEISICQSHATN